MTTRKVIFSTMLVLPALIGLTACGGNSTTPTVSENTISAQSVVTAFEKANLPVTNPRDNSKNCQDLGCQQMITTDDVTVVSFTDSAAEAKYVNAFGSNAYQKGPIVLQYAAARTPEATRATYQTQLNTLVP